MTAPRAKELMKIMDKENETTAGSPRINPGIGGPNWNNHNRQSLGRLIIFIWSNAQNAFAMA